MPTSPDLTPFNVKEKWFCSEFPLDIWTPHPVPKGESPHPGGHYPEFIIILYVRVGKRSAGKLRDLWKIMMTERELCATSTLPPWCRDKNVNSGSRQVALTLIHKKQIQFSTLEVWPPCCGMDWYLYYSFHSPKLQFPQRGDDSREQTGTVIYVVMQSFTPAGALLPCSMRIQLNEVCSLSTLNTMTSRNSLSLFFPFLYFQFAKGLSVLHMLSYFNTTSAVSVTRHFVNSKSIKLSKNEYEKNLLQM